MKAFIKIHKTRYGDIIGLCDEDVLSQMGEYTEFFQGDLVELDELEIGEFMSINAWGEHTLEWIRTHIDKNAHGMKVNGIPHIQIYRM